MIKIERKQNCKSVELQTLKPGDVFRFNNDNNPDYSDHIVLDMKNLGVQNEKYIPVCTLSTGYVFCSPKENSVVKYEKATLIVE